MVRRDRAYRFYSWIKGYCNHFLLARDPGTFGSEDLGFRLPGIDTKRLIDGKMNPSGNALSL